MRSWSRKPSPVESGNNYYARAAQQLALGGTPPYGYTGKNVRISNHTATILEVQPDEAAQVQAFYTGYGIAGQNVEQLVQAANRSGSRTRNGANWSNSAVLRILRSPVYVRGDLRSAVFLQVTGVERDPSDWNSTARATATWSTAVQPHATAQS